MILCLKELRKAFKAHPTWETTAALSVGSKQIMDQGYDGKELGRLLDSAHLMAYDMKENGQKHTDVHSALHKDDYDKGDAANANVVCY